MTRGFNRLLRALAWVVALVILALVFAAYQHPALLIDFGAMRLCS